MVDTARAIQFAIDVAKGMAFIHSLDRQLPRLYLNSHHVMVRPNCVSILQINDNLCFQIDCVSDDELVARVNMADAKFSFQEKGKMYHPAWIAPEVILDHKIHNQFLWEIFTGSEEELIRNQQPRGGHVELRGDVVGAVHEGGALL